ncbi:MAG: HEAT repeat domain-containing protein [Treponemataceae bacterium]|nr:HEAT repeat domain-containing protein [Treponemataceae bacterium]
MKLKRYMAVLLCICTAVALSAQNRTEKTAEEDYLASFEDIIIAELTASDEYDNKMLALQYIEDAVGRGLDGRDITEIQTALCTLSGEGIVSQSRTNGRLVNNFPDIRAKACDLLGELNTPEAKAQLEKIALADNEPMVTTAAIRSLGNISSEEADSAVNTIAWIERKFSVLNPTSSMAFEVLNAYEKLAPSLDDRSQMIQSISKIAVNYTYVTPVRDKAKELLRQYTGVKH